jgi:hypothetical protein
MKHSVIAEGLQPAEIEEIFDLAGQVKAIPSRTATPSRAARWP